MNTAGKGFGWKLMFYEPTVLCHMTWPDPEHSHLCHSSKAQSGPCSAEPSCRPGIHIGAAECPGGANKLIGPRSPATLALGQRRLSSRTPAAFRLDLHRIVLRFSKRVLRKQILLSLQAFVRDLPSEAQVELIPPNIHECEAKKSIDYQSPIIQSLWLQHSMQHPNCVQEQAHVSHHVCKSSCMHDQHQDASKQGWWHLSSEAKGTQPSANHATAQLCSRAK